MIKRRSFLFGVSSLTLSALVAGCGRQQQQTLKVRLLKDSIPVQLLSQFRRQLDQSTALDFTAEAQLADLFAQLKTWQQQPTAKDWRSRLPLVSTPPKAAAIADLVTLGDYWLTEAIEQQLIQPLDPTQLPEWKQLPRQWQNLVKRNDQGQLDPKGKVWGAPYRWGTTVIAYRRDKFQSLGWTPTDWSDLWREDVRDRISLLDQPREIIGLTLKKLGHSYNTQNLDKVPDLKNALRTLDEQAKFYSTKTYLEPLLMGDTWLAVGWSTDILPLMQRYRQIAAVVPQSGTALWTDLWVRPTPVPAETQDSNNPSLALLQKWINFCWQPDIARQLSLLTEAISPILVGMKPDQIPQNLKNNPLVLPPPEVIQRSEFLLPLPQTSLKQYHSLWREIRFQGLGIRDASTTSQS